MRPVISLIMVTLGLGALMRGVAALCFRGVPGAMTLPVSIDPISFYGIDIPGDKLTAAFDRGSLRLPGKLVLSRQSHWDRAASDRRRPTGSARRRYRHPESFRASLGGRLA